MKLSTINWLSTAIVLPLFITTLNIAPAGAEQMDRSRVRGVDDLPSVTDLNLRLPVSAPEVTDDDVDLASTMTPYWSDPDRNDRSISVTRKPVNPARNTSKSKTIVPSNLNSVTPLALKLQQPNKTKPTFKSRNVAMVNTESSSVITRNSRTTKPNFKHKFAAVSPLPLSGNYLKLVRDTSKGNNDVGNPIYTLEAYVDGQKVHTFDAVSGTANTQKFDRHLGNNGAPLPDGVYDVSNYIAPGTMPEVGRTFIGISPEFATGRKDLGIHLDLSFNKRNGYDGTAGCIGLTTTTDRDAVNEFVIKYRPHNLFVSIMPASN
jgi:hypothetical protein